MIKVIQIHVHNVINIQIDHLNQMLVNAIMDFMINLFYKNAKYYAKIVFYTA